MFHLFHAVHIQPHICPISYSTLASSIGHRNNFHSLFFCFFFKPFRKMMKKPRGLQKKGSRLLGTCYSHTGFTAITTEYCRSVLSIHPAGSRSQTTYLTWVPRVLEGFRGSACTALVKPRYPPMEVGVVLSPFIATIFLSLFSIIESNA